MSQTVKPVAPEPDDLSYFHGIYKVKVRTDSSKVFSDLYTQNMAIHSYTYAAYTLTHT